MDEFTWEMVDAIEQAAQSQESLDRTIGTDGGNIFRNRAALLRRAARLITHTLPERQV